MKIRADVSRALGDTRTAVEYLSQALITIDENGMSSKDGALWMIRQAEKYLNGAKQAIERIEAE